MNFKRAAVAMFTTERGEVGGKSHAGRVEPLPPGVNQAEGAWESAGSEVRAMLARAVRHAIQTSPDGVAEPIQVAVLKDGKALVRSRSKSCRNTTPRSDAAERRCANLLAPAQEEIEPPPTAPKAEPAS
jgi:hypothetical protein